jgi:phosphatidylserine/phosphatidylglycerophosphate/cardiolipin synthase-like enzyme
VKSILQAGRSCEAIAAVTRAGLVVDARDYYLTVYRALLGAQRYALIAGWQFDSSVELVRGADAEGLKTPTRLLELLEHVTRERPELHIYILSWDFSLVFALEREWLQRVKFDWMTSAQIRYVFDSQHPSGGSHHQKLVIVDGAIAFTGGIDLCESRWDNRAHPPHDPLRMNPNGEPQKPYHDVMGYASGPAVQALEALFRTRWQRATGQALELPAPIEGQSIEVVGAVPVPCDSMGISMTLGAHEPSHTPGVEQIRALYESAIADAEQLIYIETQYFTSKVVLAALCARLERPGEKLAIVIVMPEGGDTPKENFALGDAQAWTLATLARCAREHNHTLRVLSSVDHDAQGVASATFIHSKILLVDDRFLCVGSANCTNRSMSLDSELAFAWECKGEGTPMHASIAKVRASLLAEHAGIADESALVPLDMLIEQLDALIGKSKLKHRSVPESPSGISPSPILTRAFDPERALTELELDDLMEPARIS